MPSDTNGTTDVFVHDRLTGQTSRVSLDSAGTEANDGSYSASISGDGRFVTFESMATNLVPGDLNQKQDIFLHDRSSGVTTLLSVDSNGVQAN